MDQNKTDASKADISAAKSVIKTAVAEGKAIIKDGRPKIDAAMAIYLRLKDQPRDVVVKAFIDGATLTEKGAVTYWYNCGRKVAKAERAAEQPKS